MTEKSLKELLEERFETDAHQLPVFNRIALELQRLKNSEHATIKDVTNLIIKDQALTSRILQVANSSFYGGLKQVNTLSGAVMRLGMKRVASIAMVAAQLNAHSARSKLAASYMPGLWQRGFTCARGARWVAKQSGYEGRAEEAFLCGLLHDVGELFLLKVLDRLASAKDTSVVLTEMLVQEVLESMHNDIGYRLMLKWELPELYAQIARDHHLEDWSESEILMAIIRLLDMVCAKIGIGQSAQPGIVLAATEEARILGLKEIQLAQLEVLLEDSLEETAAMVQ